MLSLLGLIREAAAVLAIPLFRPSAVSGSRSWPAHSARQDILKPKATQHAATCTDMRIRLTRILRLSPVVHLNSVICSPKSTAAPSSNKLAHHKSVRDLQ